MDKTAKAEIVAKYDSQIERMFENLVVGVSNLAGKIVHNGDAEYYTKWHVQLAIIERINELWEEEG